MVMGRPREHDRKQIAADLLEWSTNPTAFNLIQFTRPRMLSVTKLPEWADEDDYFREALKLAKESIAMNRFEATLEGALPYADYAKNEAQYDPMRDKFQQRERRLELEIKKEELDHTHKLKTKENEDLSKQDSERYSNAIKAKSLIKECG
jgi:hypothetical protein